MIKDLIEKYYNGSCSDKEKEEIKAFFQEHPEEIDQYLDQSEWEDYELETPVASPAAERFLQKLGTKADADKSELSVYRNVKRLRKIPVAACLVLAIGVIGYFLLPYLQKPKIGFTDRSGQLRSLYTVQVNKTTAIKSYILPDKSEVRLYPGSQIRFLNNLEGNRRNVYLTGEAVFKVNKDVARPFTVFCREVSTTALGTVFKVKEQNNSKKVAVMLLEGKILVRSTDKKAVDGKDYYLLPGNEIAYNRIDRQFSVIQEAIDSKAKVASSKKQLNTDIIQIESGSSKVSKAAAPLAITETNLAIKFNDVRLAEVLDLLAEKRGVQIAYPTNKVANIKFIGTINDHTPIEKVLSDIAAMNNLSISVDSLNHKFILQ